MEILLTSQVLNPEEAARQIRAEESGGVVIFEGRVRADEEGKRISAIHYQAYESMAIKKLRSLSQEILERFGANCAIHHRIGRVDAGEAAVVVACAARHRKEAFEACQFAMDRIKAVVPIWKTDFVEAACR